MLTKEQFDLLKAKKPEELTDTEKASIAEYEKAEADKNKEHMIPKSRLDEEIRKKKELEDRLAAIEKAQKEAEEKRLVEANNFKTLYEQAKAEAEGLKPKAKIAEESEKVLKDVLDSQIELLPEAMRGLVPEEMTTSQKLGWMAKNKALLMKEPGIDIGAGKLGGGSDDKNPPMTAEEIEIAKKFKMTPEEYAKFK